MKTTDITKATDILRAEHTVILKVLDCLEKVARDAEKRGTLDAVSAGEMLDFLATFADRCHHGKEEDHLFPVLVAHGLPKHAGPIAVMLADHAEGREFRGQMARAHVAAQCSEPGAAHTFAAAANAYVALMRDHIDKENGVLFPMGDEMLTTSDQKTLLHAFETVEHHDLGAGVHERYLELVPKLCTRLGIDPAIPAVPGAGGCCGRHTKCGS